ncbi:hypothetical protein WMW72_34290 [Paenibacillus filicis]|uniref:Uncharacterized protein n=1 Tax=Paenibacillus filicis TaxID=669464 RepID=A0ABU9DXI7_9BACL
MSKVIIIDPHLFEKAMQCEDTKTNYEVIKHNIDQIDKKVDMLHAELDKIPSSLFLARESVIVHMEILESKRHIKMAEMEYLFNKVMNDTEEGFAEDFCANANEENWSSDL